MMYQRIPLEVVAIFTKEGTFTPKSVIFNDEQFDIIRVKSVRKYCPPGVGCFAPTEYTVIIDNQEKKLYLESNTNKWFSVKAI